MKKTLTNEVYEITEEISAVNQNVGMNTNPGMSYYPAVPTVPITSIPSLPPRPTYQSSSNYSTLSVPPPIPAQYPVSYSTTGSLQTTGGMYNQSLISNTGQQFSSYTVIICVSNNQ